MIGLVTVALLFGGALIAVYCGHDEPPEEWSKEAWRRWLNHYRDSIGRRDG